MGSREEMEIGPGVEVLFHLEQAQIRSDPILELPAISIASPTNAPQELPVARPQPDEITPSAVIRAHHKAAEGQFSEGIGDIGGCERRTIAPDDHDLLITESGEFLGGSLEPFGKTSSGLLMNLNSGKGDRT